VSGHDVMDGSNDALRDLAGAPAQGGSCGSGCGCGQGGRPERREREHWRSLEQLEGTAEARAFLEREFPEGASELPEGVDRRSFVQLLGATLSLAGLAACRKPVENIVPFVKPPEDLVPGIPKRYATTMPLGIDGYGLLVESHEGRPTKIEGNELHPATRGSASAQMQAAILGLYDPDRSQHVLARGTGGPDEGSSTASGAEHRAPFDKKSWPDFVAAWKAIEEGYLASGGAGLAILAPASSSPTLFRLATEVRQRFPQLRWATWEPVGDENSLAGVALLAGRRLRPTYDVGAARVVVSLDADLLLGESGAVAHARGFAAGRQLAAETDTMNRLWAVESAFSTTGAMADHRLALPSGQVAAFAVALAAALQAKGVSAGLPAGISGTAPEGVPARWLTALAGDLAANRGRSLVVAGRDQPPAVHALALAINGALGNVGASGAPVTLREPLDALAPSTAELASLVAAMQGGAVSTLFVLGGNPAYDAPADLAFESAMARVERVVHLGLAVDETAGRAHWHLPEAHFLESWGDCRAADGTASVIQPLIAPLFGGHSAIELLHLLSTGEEQRGLQAVRETWSALMSATVAADGFDLAFNRVLHDGLFAGSAPAPVAMAPIAAWPAELSSALSNRADAPGDSLELVFRPSPGSPTSPGCRSCRTRSPR